MTRKVSPALRMMTIWMTANLKIKVINNTMRTKANNKNGVVRTEDLFSIWDIIIELLRYKNPVMLKLKGKDCKDRGGNGRHPTSKMSRMICLEIG